MLTGRCRYKTRKPGKHPFLSRLSNGWPSGRLANRRVWRMHGLAPSDWGSSRSALIRNSAGKVRDIVVPVARSTSPCRRLLDRRESSDTSTQPQAVTARLLDALVDLHAAINRYAAEHIISPRPFVRNAVPSIIIAAAARRRTWIRSTSNVLSDGLRARSYWRRMASLSIALMLNASDAMSLAFWLNGTDSENCCTFRGGPYIDSRYFGEGIGIAVRRGNDTMRLALNWALFRVWEQGRFTDLWLRYFPISPF